MNKKDTLVNLLKCFFDREIGIWYNVLIIVRCYLVIILDGVMKYMKIKKSVRLIILLVLLFIMSGCTQYHLENTVGEDGEFIINIKYAMVDSDDSRWVSPLSEEKINLINQSGGIASIKNYDEVNQYADITYTFDDINDLCSYDEDVEFDIQDLIYDEEQSYLNKGLLNCKIEGNKVIYNAKFKFYWKLKGDNPENPDDWIYAADYKDNPDFANLIEAGGFSYKININKGHVLENNATNVSNDGKTLEWEINKTEINYMNYTFEIAENEYEIVEGDNQTYESGNDLVIKANGDIDYFVKLLVDGEELDTKYYSVKKGSTIATISSSYLSTLSNIIIFFRFK